MQVQMTPAVFKPMAAVARAGFDVHVVTASGFCKELPEDRSLLVQANRLFPAITRLNPKPGFLRSLQLHSKVLSRVPDLMTVLQRSAFEHLMDRDLSVYDSVITWSPFHSINAVMVKLKKHRKNVRWVAQFSDPWNGNPLEVSALTKMWNARHEPQAVAAADHVVHSSPYSLDLMLQERDPQLRGKTSVLPHVYSTELYPERPRATNDRITMRYLGVLYGRRSPEPVFVAMNALFARRPELRGTVVIELIGSVPPAMLQTAAAQSLPPGTVRVLPQVDYVTSLELMYDADILLLIEADIRRNLFLASKLSDYIGAGVPIVGLVPPGASEEALRGLGARYARPSDPAGVAQCIEDTVDLVRNGRPGEWCKPGFSKTFDASVVAQQFARLLTTRKRT